MKNTKRPESILGEQFRLIHGSPKALNVRCAAFCPEIIIAPNLGHCNYHSGRSVDFSNFHAFNDHTGNNLPREPNNGVLGGVHVQGLHSGDAFDHSDAPQPLVLGENGFVGSHVCKEAVSRGLTVASLNRSGRPAIQESWPNNVMWHQGNLFNPITWNDALKGVTSIAVLNVQIEIVAALGEDGVSRWLD